MIKRIILILVIIINIMTFNFTHAVGDGIYDAIKTGYVMSQAIVYDENDNPTYVVYGEDGEIIKEIAVATGVYEKASVMSAQQYNSIVKGFAELEEQIKEGAGVGARVISKDEYKAETFTTPAPENKTVDKPQLLESTKFVYVRGRETLISPEINPILFEAAINIRDAAELDANIVSILLDEKGLLLDSAEGSIGFKVAYFDNEDKRYSPRNDDKIYGPVSDVVIESGLPVIGSLAVTNEEGKYVMHYFLPPCPGFDFEYNSHLFAQLRYRNFNPKSRSPGIYYSSKYIYDYCPGFGDTLKHVPNLLAQMTYLAIVGIKAAYSSVIVRVNFRIDTMLLTGKAKLGNTTDEFLPLGDTLYEYESQEREVIAQDNYDFDGDGEVDIAVLGIEQELDLDDNGEVDKDIADHPIKYFKRQESGATHQGIYLSSTGRTPASEGEAVTKDNQPDFTRLADLKAEFEDQGLASSISLDDLKNTDVYVFRVANGDLITERQGIADSEIPFGAIEQGEDNEVYYRILMRGPDTTRLFSTERFEQWQERSKINPKLHQKDSDHLRPGEKVNIIAINRATGYIGNTISELKQTSTGGDISFSIDDIVMRPPNLKVRATRVFDIEKGLSKSDEPIKNLISFEGSALKSDKYIKVETEWLAHDGSPLPEELDEYGYTGRLAKVTGGGVLGAAGNGLAHFKVKPGYNLQLVKLSDDVLSTEHYYVQIHGEPKDRSPDFETTGAGQGILQYRPKHYVPFKVPLYDEESSLAVKLAFNRIRNEREGQEGASNLPELQDPEPVYQWAYRPEMQFSVYDLTVEEIDVTDQFGTVFNLLETNIPAIGHWDTLVSVLYSYLASEFQRLDTFGQSGDFVLALGEQELQFSVDENSQIGFTNIEHLAQLAPEDFLSIRLYNNNDAGNVLWEWAFEYLNFYPLLDLDEVYEDGIIRISADEPEVDLIANLFAFADRPEDEKYDVNIRWELKGSGTLDKQRDSDNKYAIFENKLTLPQQKGKQAKVVALLQNEQRGDVSAAPIVFEVVPGKPSNIELEYVSGKIFVGGKGEYKIKATVKDAWGNLVVDDTEVTLATVEGIEIVEKPESTVNGVFEFSLKGAEFAEMAEVEATVGGIKQTLALEVHPVDITIEGLPGTYEVGKEYPFSVRVTADGAAAADYDVDVWAKNGRLSHSTLVTNVNGYAYGTLFVAGNEGVVDVKAMVGLQEPVVVSHVASIPNDDKTRVNNSRAKIIGDAAADGVYQYTRWDGAPFAVETKVSGEIKVTGKANESVTLNLDDVFEPNRQTLAAYWMNESNQQTGIDQAGFANAELHDISLNEDTRLKAGNSYQFVQPVIPQSDQTASWMGVVDSSHLLKENDLSFSLDINSEQAVGEVVNLGQGLVLSLLNDGSLEAKVTTDDGQSHSLVQPSFSLNSWQRVAVQFANNTLTLAVGSSVVEKSVTGNLAYEKIARTVLIEGVTTSKLFDLVVGKNFRGKLNSLKWFDLSSGPLISFVEDGVPVQQLTVELGADGSLLVPVQSHGNMQHSGSQLPMQGVAFSIDSTMDNAFGSVSLLSTNAFELLASRALSAGIVEGAPDYDMDAYYASVDSLPGSSNHLMEGFFPHAYAYDLGFWTIVDIVSSLIGLDSLGVIWDQVGNMLAGREVDIVALSIAILDVLTLFPPAAPLKVITGPAKLAIKALRLGNTKAVKYLGGVMKRIYQKAKKRDFTLVFQGIAFFIIVADMYSDPDAREGIKELAKMINSTDDFIDFLDYFSLFDDEIELSEETAYLNHSDTSNQLFASTMLFPKAHAGVPAGTGRAIGKIIKELAPVLAKGGKGNAKIFGDIGRVAGKSANKSLKKVAKNKSFLRGSLSIGNRVGVTSVRKLLTSGNNKRIRPLLLIAIIAYLEKEVDDGNLFPDSQDPFDREHNLSELRKLYVDGVPAFLPNQSAGYLARTAHGASFHLMALAFFHAQSKASGEAEVLGIEVPRNVYIYDTSTFESDGKNRSAKNGKPFERIVDLLIGKRNESEQWVELKSWKSKTETNRNLARAVSPWGWGKGPKDEGKGDNSHKQFILDRVAKRIGAQTGKHELIAKEGDKSQLDITVSNVIWSFHKFTTKDKNKKTTAINPSLANIEKEFLQPPKGSPPKGHAVAKTEAKGFLKLGLAKSLLDVMQTELKEAILEDLAETGFQN